MVYYRILNILPCAIQQDFAVYPSYIYNSLHLLIQTPNPFFPHPSATTGLFCVCSCFVQKFISVIFYILHISDIIWYCLSDLTSLSMIISRSIHEAADSMISFILQLGNTSLWAFPGGSVGKKSTYNAGDVGSILGSGRSPGEGNGNPFQYSCLGNPMHRIA